MRCDATAAEAFNAFGAPAAHALVDAERARAELPPPPPPPPTISRVSKLGGAAVRAALTAAVLRDDAGAAPVGATVGTFAGEPRVCCGDGALLPTPTPAPCLSRFCCAACVACGVCGACCARSEMGVARAVGCGRETAGGAGAGAGAAMGGGGAVSSGVGGRLPSKDDTFCSEHTDCALDDDARGSDVVSCAPTIADTVVKLESSAVGSLPAPPTPTDGSSDASPTSVCAADSGCARPDARGAGARECSTDGSASSGGVVGTETDDVGCARAPEGTSMPPSFCGVGGARFSPFFAPAAFVMTSAEMAVAAAGARAADDALDSAEETVGRAGEGFGVGARAGGGADGVETTGVLPLLVLVLLLPLPPHHDAHVASSSPRAPVRSLAAHLPTRLL
jgi:hypothetical protein